MDFDLHSSEIGKTIEGSIRSFSREFLLGNYPIGDTLDCESNNFLPWL